MSAAIGARRSAGANKHTAATATTSATITAAWGQSSLGKGHLFKSDLSSRGKEAREANGLRQRQH